jgi:hypothetical protein
VRARCSVAHARSNPRALRSPTWPGSACGKLRECSASHARPRSGCPPRPKWSKKRRDNQRELFGNSARSIPTRPCPKPVDLGHLHTTVAPDHWPSFQARHLATGTRIRVPKVPEPDPGGRHSLVRDRRSRRAQLIFSVQGPGNSGSQGRSTIGYVVRVMRAIRVPVLMCGQGRVEPAYAAYFFADGGSASITTGPSNGEIDRGAGSVGALNWTSGGRR